MEPPCSESKRFVLTKKFYHRVKGHCPLFVLGINGIIKEDGGACALLS
jgi:hypothetical protein